MNTPPQSTLKFWHGAHRWEGDPKLHPAKPENYQCGPGLYLTTRYETARKYAKGGGQTVLVELDSNTCLLEDATLTLPEMLEGLASLPRVKDRKGLIADLKRSAERHARRNGEAPEVVLLPAYYLMNYCINARTLGGESGPALAKWYANKGIDASVTPQSGDEEWLTVFNMDKVVSCLPMKADAAWPLGNFQRIRVQRQALEAASDTVEPIPVRTGMRPG